MSMKKSCIVWNLFFEDTSTIIFGTSDSNETAIDLANQCPVLKRIEAKGIELSFEEAARLPTSLNHLELEQGAISADQFIGLVKLLGLSELSIHSATFDSEARNAIRSACPKCKLAFISGNVQ